MDRLALSGLLRSIPWIWLCHSERVKCSNRIASSGIHGKSDTFPFQGWETGRHRETNGAMIGMAGGALSEVQYTASPLTQRCYDRCNMGVIIVLLLVLLLFGGSGVLGPIPYGYGYGHPGMGALGTILVVVIILALLGYM